MGNVNHLDTKNFNDTVSAYANHITRFEEIVQNVNNINHNVISSWKGKGARAYEKDCKQVQLNLQDISDIMYELRDALINAESEYVKSDLELSKSFES